MATSDLQRAAHDDRAGAVTTMCAAFQRTVADHGDVVALRTLGDAAGLTWRDYGDRVRRLATGLHSLGLRRGDTLAMMLTNRPEFHLVDAAAMHLGVVPFSVYNPAAPDQIEFLVRDAGPRVAVVEDAFRDRLHTDEVIGVEQLTDLEARGDGSDFDFDAAWRAVTPDDVLTLIYTSGTTGDPKGVQITHRNMVFTARAYAEVIGFPTNAAVVSYLPMAHIAERNCSHYFPMLHGFTVTCLQDARQVVASFPEVRPAWFFAVPRIFEKLKAAIEADADQPLRDSIDRGLARVSGAGRVAGLTQVEWQSCGRRRSGACGVVVEFVPEVPGAVVEEQGAAVGARAFADRDVGRVFPERRGCVESSEAAADGGLADASVAVAGEERQLSAGGLSHALALPGGEEVSQLGWNGEHATVRSDEDGAVAGEASEVGVAQVVRAASEDGDGDQRHGLRVRVWSASATA
jgi:acyl-CoA synthetase (AMP-forming)/AMP-acid ligase II